MKGEWIKICIIFLVVVSFFPWNALAGQIEPPSIQTGKNILDKTSSTTKSFLTGIRQGIGNIIDSVMPTIKNSDKTITVWWKGTAKPWILDLWSNAQTYLSKEIIID